MLIKCPKCKTMFDDKLSACPSCGFERHIAGLYNIEPPKKNDEVKIAKNSIKEEEKIIEFDGIDIEEKKEIDKKVEELLQGKKIEEDKIENKEENIPEEAELLTQEPIIEEISFEEDNSDDNKENTNVDIIQPVETVENQIATSEISQEEKPEIAETIEKINTESAEETVPEPVEIVTPEPTEETTSKTEEETKKEEILKLIYAIELYKEKIEEKNAKEEKTKIPDKDSIDKSEETAELLKEMSLKEPRSQGRTKQTKSNGNGTRMISLALIFILFIGVATFSYFYYMKNPDAFATTYSFVQDKIVLATDKITQAWDSAYDKTAKVLHLRNLSVSISSEPSGADIYLDDVALNRKTPFTIEKVEPGIHILHLKLKGYDEYSYGFLVTKYQKEVLSINAKLVKTKTLLPLSITSNPSGAEIFINGKDLNKTTPAIVNYEPGTYEIELRMNGYKTVSITQVLKDKPEEVNLSLKKNAIPITKRRMGLTSNPEGGEVWIDGKDTGKKTPCDIYLIPGNYKVVIKTPGYYDWVREKIEITEDFDDTFFALLTKKE